MGTWRVLTHAEWARSTVCERQWTASAGRGKAIACQANTSYDIISSGDNTRSPFYTAPLQIFPSSIGFSCTYKLEDRMKCIHLCYNDRGFSTVLSMVDTDEMADKERDLQELYQKR